MSSRLFIGAYGTEKLQKKEQWELVCRPHLQSASTHNGTFCSNNVTHLVRSESPNRMHRAETFVQFN